jgi:hypothetical protein
LRNEISGWGWIVLVTTPLMVATFRDSPSLPQLSREPVVETQSKTDGIKRHRVILPIVGCTKALAALSYAGRFQMM